jgi:NarL family two-component system response regulator LiaR
MEVIRIVLADDHALVREGIREVLVRHDDLQVVGEAADGEEAVALVADLCPDVALVDIAMPRLNGIEVTRRIKSLSPTTSVLVLTAYDDDQYVFALLEAGAAGYLLKSVRGRELAEAVRSVHAGEAVLHPAIARKVLNRFVASGDAPVDRNLTDPLTEREMEVLRLAAKGKSNKSIAQELGLSVRTVQGHLGQIFAKLNVASRTEAVIHGLRQGWFRIEEVS